ncbi:3-hydroxyacyl-CoA dehydrogenase NAD-binding domain-containing protein [Amaricoccus sp.]|uniref:3-hydroxyacyl-CoA dehydrogenase NAD-binding domain-containing protein n=1 Tax=Amaricoccus sp. TaxID=1872485 RepID=UPI0025BC5CD8|nr:3-hydroxyacyl-CoA dehydrogenase NAD-binding domain-containing protein [Amaricoccus sp.]
MAVVTVDNPPVNALSQAVRAGLVAALAETEADADVRAVVLACAGRTFVAGADIAELGRPPVEPHLPDVILAIEGATKPWVAAIHGSALGGGLELALACRWRVADAAARLGLPEVSLGLIPGAGGTVRLPRLIAPVEALAMIAGGKPVGALRAAELGLVDEVAEGDLVGAAVAFAEGALARDLPAPLAARPPLGEADADFEAAAAVTLAKARGQAAPVEAVAAVRDALTLDFTAALAAERRRFLALRDGPQSKALRHVFAAERGGGRRPTGPLLPTDVIGVVGGGTMGAGIATACLLAGREVVLVERDDEALARGMASVRGNLDGSLKRGVLDAAGHAAALARLTGATDYAALGRADLVIEAVFEDLEVKAAVFAALDAATRPEAILATNTSYLDVDRIAAMVRDPGRVVGLHFFAPAHVMKLVEVVRPAAVRPEVFETATAFARSLGKTPVESGVCDGFIGNRILTRYRQAMDILLLEGALPWEVDAAMEGFGMAMGPYAVQDLSGLEIAWAGRRRMDVRARDDWRYVPIADRMVEEARRLGRKSGAGWYDYAGGRPAPAPAVEALILDVAAQAGVARRPVGAAEIRDRALAAMVQEAARLLEEGIAARASDVDLVLIHGYGFPRWRGGPLHWAEAKGLPEVVGMIDGLAAGDPRTWQAPPLLRRFAAEGRGFAS